MHTIRIPTDQDLQNYPHVFFTSPDIWDASVLDHEITPSLLEDINEHSDESLLQDSIFDEYGDLHHRAIQTLNIFCDLPSPPSREPLTHAYMHDSNPAEEDWKSLRPYFGWQSEQVIKNTYQVTSRFGGTIPQHDYLKKHFKSRNPITKWMKVNLTTDFPPNLMRREAIGLALLKTREINSPGRFLLMTLTLSSSDLLSGVPFRLQQTSDWTHHKGRINHKISHLMCLFMVGPILMGLTTHHPCPSLILMTYWENISPTYG